MFATIVDYYLKTHPESKNATRIPHVSDGPEGERLHIEVPVAVRAEYLHPYEPAFLAKQSTSKNGLARLIAGELVLLRNEKLFTIPDSGEEIVGDRIIYVVKVKPTR